MLGRIPTALSNSHASVAHPRDGRRARLAGSSDPGGVTSKRRLRPSSSPKASLVDINNLQGVKPSNLTSDTPLGSRPKRGQHFVGPDSRRGTVNRLIYATKKSAISLPLHLLFSSRGYTICLPFQKTAAMNSCQLLNALTLRVIRQICKFFNLFQDIICDSMPSRLVISLNKACTHRFDPNFFTIIHTDDGPKFCIGLFLHIP